MSLDIANKYDRLAEGFAERSWANLEFDMERRFHISATWGKTLVGGDSVLELGCGDGYLARLFVKHGLRYRGVDISPKMAAMSEEKLRAAGLKAEFVVTDVSQVVLSEPFDAVVSYMGTFFSYVGDPLAVLKRFRPYIRKKAILDLNPRQNIPPQAAVEVLKQAGFTNVAWRPFFVPKQKKLPEGVLKTLAACENIPLLRSLPLHWKFHVLVKGETR
jgi:ubiquinone/menaquinone biosynthesis C-methylase UbiE